MSSPLAVELGTGAWRIPTVQRSAVNSVLLAAPNGSLVLIDAGVKKRSPARILAALAELGRSPEEIRHLVVSHAHSDHAGGLRELQGRTTSRTSAHEIEAPHLRAGRAPARDRSLIAGRVLNLLPGTGFAAAEVHDTFVDNDRLALGGGLRVLHTPGHTPGHCSFLHESSGVLIASDALFNWRHRLSYGPRFFTSDHRLTRESADRLGEADYEVIAFMHGEEIRDRAREQVRDHLRSRGH